MELYNKVVEVIISMKARVKFSEDDLLMQVGFDDFQKAKDTVVQIANSVMKQMLDKYHWVVYDIRYYKDINLYVPESYSCIVGDEVKKQKLYFYPDIHYPITRKMYVLNDKNYKWIIANYFPLAMIIASDVNSQ